jgi:hypothetical protein
MASVKWLTRIDVLDREFDGYQNSVAYRYRTSADDPGVPVTRIRPRALLTPPGFPDFMTRTRVVDAGEQVLTGRAWCGTGVRRARGGQHRWRAHVGGRPARPGRRPVRLALLAPPWAALPGTYVLTCRATAADGSTQPLDQPWNRSGMGNNTVQRVEVLVR